MNKIGLYLFFIIVTAYSVLAASFSLTTYYDGAIFNYTENETIYLDVNVSCSEALVEYSDDSGSLAVNFSVFNQSPDTGVIQFVPANDDVGMSEDILISVTNRSDAADYLTFKIYFNVSNINNRPYLVSANPGNATIPENTLQVLTVNVGDVDIPYGDYLSYNWTLDGNLSPNLSFSNNTANYSVGLNQDVLGSHIIQCIATDTGGYQYVHTWNITVDNQNTVPVLNSPISNITINEDDTLPNNFSLDNHFIDLDVNSTNHDVDLGTQLLYTIYSANTSEPIEITVGINQTFGNVSFFPASDWNGNKTFFFTVFDGLATVYSNNFSFEVIPVNDDPSINNLLDQAADANALFSYAVNATDVDGDVLTYYGNSSVFLINSSTGIISTYPNSSTVGVHSINISVDDGNVNVSQIFGITVSANFIPYIDPIADQSIMQESTIFINVSGWDQLGDNLTFSMNFSSFGQGNRINSTLTTFNLTPLTQALIGNHTVRATVDDGIGITNYTEFNLEITDLKKPPVLTHIADYQIKVNTTFYLPINAFDEDGNIDEFSTNSTDISVGINSSGSEFSNATGYISWYPNTTTMNPIAVNISVNDTTQYSDSQIILINVTPNYAPYFTFISNISCDENEDCPISYDGFTAADPNWQDTITFSDNTTLFNITSAGNISFTTGSSRYEAVMINITDGEFIVTQEIFVNITQINDAPFFSPTVAGLAVWASLVENSTYSFNITAYDEENDTVSFQAIFLNFTDIIGNVTFSGIELFNISNLGNVTHNQTIGQINFTPNSSQTGTYWMNISVDDGDKISSEVFSFDVQNINNRPDAAWNLTYGNYSTSSQTQINATENTTISIEVSASDADFDSITFIWERSKPGDSTTLLSTSESINYSIGFSDSPLVNLTLSVIDDNNVSLNITWEISVTNLNRNHWFGGIYDTVFNGESLINVTNSSSISLIDSGGYSLHGKYESQVFDIGETNAGIWRFNLTYLEYSATIPANTNITFMTRTKSPGAGANYTAWEYLGAGGSIVSTSKRYVQYKAIFVSNGTETPILNWVRIHYSIANITGTENTEQLGWINLENFFTDRDSDDIFTYQAHTGSLAYYINTSVRQDNFIQITFETSGTETLNFSCTDQDNRTVYSNPIDVTILTSDTDTSPQVVFQPRTSSGGGTVIKYKTKIQMKSEYVNLDIIHPDNVTFYENDIMIIPITLRNNGNETLSELNMTAVSENDFVLELSKTEVESLDPGDEETFTITANISEVYDSFQVLVVVQVKDPVYTDSAKITVNSLKKGEANRELFDIKYAFAQDLLAQNTQCIELTEFLNRARDSFTINDLAGGINLVDSFIEDCRYLISEQADLARPDKISTAAFLVDKVSGDRNIRYVVYLLSFIVLFFFGYITYIKYRNI